MQSKRFLVEGKILTGNIETLQNYKLLLWKNPFIEKYYTLRNAFLWHPN